MTIMKIRFLILTLFFTICFSAVAQDDPFQEDIITYLNNNGTREQYSGAYDSMFDVLKQQFSASNVPDSVWKDLQKDKDKSLDEIVKFLTFAYRNHFTRDEINEMNSFFQTDAARQMVKDPSALNDTDQQEISRFYDSELGKKIEEKRPDLTKDIVEISEHWSRDLFSEKMSKLVKLGYSTGH
jgi:hypothetical protein